jgi:hypothetical protein
MLKITDAERKKEVEIPGDLARVSGVFNEIMDNQATRRNGLVF